MKAAVLLISFLLCVCFSGNTQICNGSLGDAILNETFGTTRQPLPLRKTNFDYVPGCPAKGQYTTANLIFGCGEDRSWLVLPGDHTRDVNGNYMLVSAQSADGITVPAVVHQDTARGLCNNVTYVYAAWVTNALRPISCGGNAVPSQLIFKVTTLAGVVLGSFETGDLEIEDERKWKEYGLSFQVPSGEESVILTIITNRRAGCGQAFAIDDITLHPCGPELTATINDATAPLDVCANFTGNFNLKGTYTDGFANPSVQWQSSLDTGKTWNDVAAATSLNYTPPRQDEGIILYRMAVAEGANISVKQCRFLSNEIYTNVHPLPPHRAPENLIGCLGKDLPLPAKNPFAHRNVWTGPNNFSSTSEKAIIPAITSTDAGLYVLTQDFGFGCFASDSFYVQVFPATTISVPPVYSVCEGQSVTLQASGEGIFSWQPATGLSNSQVNNPIASPRDSTLYKVFVTNSYGCMDSALVMVNVFRNPQVFAGPNKMIVRGDTAVLNGTIAGTSVKYYWSPSAFMSDNTARSPQVFPPSTMQYTLTAESTIGCGKAEASVMVNVFNDVYVPNAFSPNNDGKNEQFKIIGADSYQLQKFEVYNRWGQLVYQSTNFNKGWDGTYKSLQQPADTYTYFIQIRSAGGKTITKKGTVVLIR